MRRTNLKISAGAALASLVLVAACSKPPPPPPAAPAAKIHVLEASYGLNCAGEVPGVPKRFPVVAGNVTSFVAEACEGRATCAYTVDVAILKDPAPECPKDFSATYKCAADGQALQARIEPEANLKTATLSCQG